MRKKVAHKYSILTLILGIGLVACESETHVEYFIENKSSSTLLVKGENRLMLSPIEVLVAPGETQSVLHWSKFGKEVVPFPPESVFSDKLLITNASGDTSQIDAHFLWNWQWLVENYRAVAMHAYTLEIQDTDF